MNRYNGVPGSATGKEADAFAQLYTEYRQAVYATCLAILKDPGLAEDAMQVTFLEALLDLPQFQEGRAAKPWLYQIARRNSIDILRRRRRGRECSLDEITDNGAASLLDNRQDPFSDATVEGIISDEQMLKLRHMLSTLAPRQRRALLLSVLEGWSNAEIASAEGISLGAVSLLLVRARQKLRDTREKLGALVPSWSALKERLDAAIGQSKKLLYIESDRWAAFGGQALLAAGIGLCVCLIAQPGSPASAGALSAPGPVNESSVRMVQASGGFGKAPPAKPSDGKTQSPGPASDTAPVQKIATVASWVEPSPDYTRFQSIEPSPNYAEDHTVFAAGTPSNSPYLAGALFVSRDGGANWEWLPAVGLTGTTVLLPPNYPQDDRIFVMGPNGLQESVDGGKSFMLVSPVSGQAVISPGYGSGDRRIIIRSIGTAEAQLIFEYLVDERLTRPLYPSFLTGYYASIDVSPRFPADPTILVGKSASLGSPTGFYRCTGSVCEGDALKGRLDLSPGKIWFSPAFEQDNTVYALVDTLIRSVDMMRSYESLGVPESYWISDMTISPVQDSARLFLTGMPDSTKKSADWDTGEMYVSEDRGDSWKLIEVAVPGFGPATGRVAVAPTGRIFVTSLFRGLACSEDGGYSWKGLCSPEK